MIQLIKTFVVEYYWYLAVNRKLSLHRLFTMIDPFLKHAKRRRDMRRAWANIKARGLS